MAHRHSQTCRTVLITTITKASNSSVGDFLFFIFFFLINEDSFDDISCASLTVAPLVFNLIYPDSSLLPQS